MSRIWRELHDYAWSGAFKVREKRSLLALLALGGLLLGSRTIVLLGVLVNIPTKRCQSSRTDLIIILILVILVALVLIIIFVVLVLEVVLIEVVHALLELQGLASKPVDRTGNKLLLDVLTKLVVKLKLGLDILVNLLIVILLWGCGRVEEVEE
jgi:hypothetical protein